MQSSKFNRDREEQFKIIKSKIKNYLKNNQIPPKDVYTNFLKEYKALLRYPQYQDKNGIHRLFIEHNFFPLFSTYYLFYDKNKSLDKFFLYYFKGIKSLLRRHSIQPYKNINKMFSEFVAVAMKFKENTKINLTVNNVLFCLEKLKELIDEIKSINNGKYREFIKRNENLGKSLSIVLSRISFSIERTSMEDVKHNPTKYLKLLRISNYYIDYHILDNDQFFTSLYKISKYLLFYNAQFGKDLSKNEQVIKEVCDYLKVFSKKSLQVFNKNYRRKQSSYKEDLLLKTKALKEIDVLNAEYYSSLFVEGNLDKAWKTIDEIKSFIFTKIFEENIEIEEKTLKYFLDEWNFLLTYLKILLLKMDVDKIGKDMSLNWLKDLNAQVKSEIEKIEEMFKFSKIKTIDEYTIKIVSKRLGGHLSEFLIYGIIQEIMKVCSSNNISKSETSLPQLLIDLIIYDKENTQVYLNYPVSNTDGEEADIDIYIEGKSKKLAIFFKNQRLRKFKQIRKEIDLACEKDISEIIYCVNIAKNLDNLNKLKQYKESEFKGSKLYIYDIKDFTETLLQIGKNCGKSPINFSKLDLFKMLDY